MDLIVHKLVKDYDRIKVYASNHGQVTGDASTEIETVVRAHNVDIRIGDTLSIGLTLKSKERTVDLEE